MSMRVLSNFDWWGTDEELKAAEKKIKEECDKTDGVTYLGIWVPHNTKFHYTRMWDVDDWNNYWAWERPPRDKKKASHIVMEYLSKPDL